VDSRSRRRIATATAKGSSARRARSASSRPRNQSSLRAPATQSRHLGRPGPLANVHAVEGASVVVDLSPFEFLDRLADLVPPSVSLARGPPTEWGELVQVHDNRAIFQASPDELPAIDIHSL
jgi:hypothetical protein